MTMNWGVAAGLLGLAVAFAPPPAAGAADKTAKVVGVVVKVALAEAEAKPPAPAKAAEAVVTLLVRGKKLEILVRDELTLKKLRIKKINLDDEVRVQYRVIEEDGVEKNLAVTFRRSAGC